jgi:hydroxymethylpyrimidine pyrophosphatase-like HAD family hydrolase
MRYLALACDYDGTLASDGVVPSATVAALEQVRATIQERYAPPE